GRRRGGAGRRREPSGDDGARADAHDGRPGRGAGGPGASQDSGSGLIRVALDTSALASGGGGGNTPSLTAADVARLVGGRLAAGDDARVVRRVAPLHRAESDELTFLASAKYAEAFAQTRAGVALVAPALAELAGPADIA